MQGANRTTSLKGWGLVWLLSALTSAMHAAEVPPPFPWHEQERVVLVGDSLLEAERPLGYLEFLLVTHRATHDVTCRHFSLEGLSPEQLWPADALRTNTAAAGLARLTRAFRPTIAVLGFALDALPSNSPADAFATNVARLMDTIRQNSGSNSVRFIALSPLRKTRIRPGETNAALAAADTQLRQHHAALQALASARPETVFVPLYEALNNDRYIFRPPPLSDDGQRLNHYGYRRLAELLAVALAWEPPVWRLGVLPDGKPREGGYGTRILELEKKEDTCRVVTLEENLPMPPWPKNRSLPSLSPSNRLQVQGLKEGSYILTIDGRSNGVYSAAELLRSIALSRGPQYDQAEQLRVAIVRKNELAAQLWPVIVGTNHAIANLSAAETERTQADLRQKEEEIARLRQPVRHVFELKPMSPASPAKE